MNRSLGNGLRRQNMKKHINSSDKGVLHSRKKGHVLKDEAEFRLIDLFSGAGGLTLGFTGVFGCRIRPVWTNDFNKFASETYKLNFGEHCICGDILEILKDPATVIPKADIVIGGPPCQGFSLLNKKRKADARNQLWRPFLDIVEQAEAPIFVMQNVPQLLGSLEHQEIIEIAESLGFRLAWAKLSAADYGVPQTRSRAFIIGCKFTDPSKVFPPKKTSYNSGNGKDPSYFASRDDYIAEPKPWRTVRDAISDLPPPTGTTIRADLPPLDLHFGRSPTQLSLKRYKAIPIEGMNRFDLQRLAPDLTPKCWIKKKTGGTDLFGRLWWDRPSVTIRTEFFKPEKGRYLHPEQHRPITHREAARFQSFPDSFRFAGTKIEIAKQIGNAVPPLLAEKVAESIYTLFQNRLS